MIILKKIHKHIIWDWNGTLVDDTWLCVEIVNGMLKKRNKPPITYEQYRADFNHPVKDYYMGIGIDFTIESFEIIADEFITEHDKRRFDCKLQNNVGNMLKFCIDVGLTQSILSAYPQIKLEETVNFYGLHHYFTNIIGLNNHYACSKIEQGRQLIKELGLLPKEIMFVGDTLHDFEAAKEIGVDCILVCNGHNHPYKLQSCGVRVLNSMAEVKYLLS
ncbi:MAG: HAD family hydrolase [Sedimentisphaerales bacterium]